MTPAHGDRAWIKLAGSITAELQLHEEMDSEDLNCYFMHQMTPIEGVYHRRYHCHKFDVTKEDEVLTKKELNDPLLIEMLSCALEDGFYFESIDRFTGRKEKLYRFSIPEELREYETDAGLPAKR